MRKNTENESNEDFNFVRCRWCKFPLDKSRDRIVPRQQITFTAYSPAPSDSDAPYNFTMSGGCPKCGCPQPY